jgi:pyruvate,water dikinase
MVVAISKEKVFTSPYEHSIPGTEGWERMYPHILLFHKDRKGRWEKLSWMRQMQHWPKLLTPFDACATLLPAQLGLTPYQRRVFVLPVGGGLFEPILNGYVYQTETPPITDQKEVEERAKEFIKKLTFINQNFDEIYPKWKKSVRKILDEQWSLYDEIQDLPYIEELSFFAEVRGITSGHKLIEIYDKVIELYNKIQIGYQYQWIGVAYAAYLSLLEFCKQAFPKFDERDLISMITGAELEAFRPDQELRQLAKLAVDLGLSQFFEKATKFEGLQEELRKTDRGREWLKEFDKVSYPWFYMMVSEGVFATCNDECWIENPSIILGFLKNYIEMIKKGENIERDVKSLIRHKEELFKKLYDSLKTEDEKKRFKELYEITSKLYISVEDQVLYVKNFNYALLRRNIRKFAEILAKHGIIKEPNDIFYLRFEEIKAALQELLWIWGNYEPPTDYFKKEIEWRKQMLETFKKWRPPAWLGPWKEVPEEPFFIIHGGLVADRVDIYRKVEHIEELTEIKGWPASPGVVEGVSRVIHESKDIRELRPGEILVCPHTSPAWTPAFAIIKAVVTEQGGVMSHAGIVSREYGIPAVVGTYCATQVIKTGDLVRVDGNNGVVTILKRAE